MKKLIIRVFALCFVFINLLSFTVLAAESSAVPSEPYEKVVAKSGRWYAEQLEYSGRKNLVVGYVGSYDSSGTPGMKFEIKEKVVLSAIYIPVSDSSPEDIILSLKDARGNIYKGFSVEMQKTGGLREAGETGSYPDNTTCIFTPDGDIALPKGSYELYIEGTSGLTGAFLVKGVHFKAYEKYMQALQDWELENNPVDETAAQTFGKEALSEDSGEEYDYGEAEAVSTPMFALDMEYQIDEIIVSTYNDGKGSSPGIVSILDESGKILFSGQSYGVSIEDIPNGAWKIAPGILLPAGKYAIVLSQPEVLSYDQDGEPLFYVKASIPVQVREDFTGTYKINLDTYKTSTLMGQVPGKNSSFSLNDFELTVLDKGGEIELIGQYEGLPFSQSCQIVEETAEKITARFNFEADLTKLPYKAKITAAATITLARTAGGEIKVSMDGAGTYDRTASADKGADHNTYKLKAVGNMTQRELPPFVMTALGKTGGAGNIPGPDNAAQAAAGILFPPLAGVVVSVVQELLKPKEVLKNAAKAVMRDKNWYKKKYPNLSNEQIAMVMLGDAMGNTDNPDEGDAISVGDNEGGTGSSSSAGEKYPEVAHEEESELEPEPEPESEQESEPEHEPEPQQKPEPEPKLEPEREPERRPDEEQAEPQPIPADELPQEPETMVVQTSANGAQTLYVKDPTTGEWVDPETNSVLDLEKHGEALEQLNKEKDWNDAEFEKMSKGETEHDLTLRKRMAEIREKEQKESYENTLRTKYGTDNLNEIADIVEKRRDMAQEWADIWRRNDKVLGVAEVGAVAVGTASDIAIDGLAIITPGGTKIRAGYKIAKGMAGTYAEAGAKGKEIFNKGNFAEGFIKGGADAALDYIPGGGGVKTVIAKAGVTVIGESAGSAAGAALRNENVGEAFTGGLKAGAYKAAVGAITDAVAGELPNPVINRGSFKAVPNMKNVVVSGAGGVKLGSALVDEYVTKPAILGD